MRITTSLDLVDYGDQGINAGIRFGLGKWPGMRIDRLMSENIFPVCSPALLTGGNPLKTPEDLIHHTLLHVTSTPDNWSMWLTAAGVKHPYPNRGPQFDMLMMATRAAMDGMGVAVVGAAMAEADLEGDRLVRPFDLAIAAEAAYYFVTPEVNAELPKVTLFRDWLQTQVSK